MRLLVDEGVDGPVVRRLREAGYDVVYVAELAPGLSDASVFEMAHAGGRVLVTMDKDFGEISMRRRGVGAGIVLVRLAGLTPGMKAEAVVSALADHAEAIPGSFTVITPQAVRIRSVTP